MQLNLQEKLKVAEEQIVSNNDINDESEEDLRAELERREKALRNTEEERDTLMSELEELDRQNQQATQVCYCCLLLFVGCFGSCAGLKIEHCITTLTTLPVSST